MDKVDRFRPQGWQGIEGAMWYEPDGEYVRHADYQKLYQEYTQRMREMEITLKLILSTVQQMGLGCRDE